MPVAATDRRGRSSPLTLPAPGAAGDGADRGGPAADLGRIGGALAELASRHGYDEVSSADVERLAGVETGDLLARFGGTDGCLLVVYEDAVATAEESVADSLATGIGAWTDRLVEALDALLSCVASNPPIARLCLVDALAVGPAPRTRYEDTVERFAALLRQARAACPDGDRLPGSLEESLAGGVLWFIRGHVLEGELDRLSGHHTELARFVLTPYVGADAAAAAARRGSRRPVR